MCTTGQAIRKVSDCRERRMTGHGEKEGNVYIGITTCSLNIYSQLLPSVLTNDRSGLEYKIFSWRNWVSLQQAAQASWSFRHCDAAWWRPLWMRLWQLLFMFHWALELFKNNVCIMYKMYRRVWQKWHTLLKRSNKESQNENSNPGI